MARLQAVDDGRPDHASAICDPDALITAAESTSPAWRFTCVCPHLTVQAIAARPCEDVGESKVEAKPERTGKEVKVGVRFSGFQLSFDSCTDAWKVSSIVIALAIALTIAQGFALHRLVLRMCD